MSTVGQIEKRTQARIVALLRDRLHYTYLGNWIDRAGNANIEPERLSAWLAGQGVDPTLAGRALFKLQKVAGDTSQSLYDRNREVYPLAVEADQLGAPPFVGGRQRPQKRPAAFGTTESGSHRSPGTAPGRSPYACFYI